MLEFLETINPTLTGALGFFMGLLVGHRLTLTQHRRQEYNAFAGALRAKIVHHLDFDHNAVYFPSAVELDQLRPYQTRWQHRRLCDAVEKHRACYNKNFAVDSSGSWSLRDPAAVKASLVAVLDLVPVR